MLSAAGVRRSNGVVTAPEEIRLLVRVPNDVATRFRRLAHRRGTRTTTLLRDWVTERLAEEERLEAGRPAD